MTSFGRKYLKNNIKYLTIWKSTNISYMDPIFISVMNILVQFQCCENFPKIESCTAASRPPNFVKKPKRFRVNGVLSSS